MLFVDIDRIHLGQRSNYYAVRSPDVHDAILGERTKEDLDKSLKSSPLKAILMYQVSHLRSQSFVFAFSSTPNINYKTGIFLPFPVVKLVLYG